MIRLSIAENAHVWEAFVKIERPPAAPPSISMVAMIDILMIMLIFFMVTSTYLNLTMLPLAQSDPSGAASSAAQSASPQTILLRLTGDGVVVHQGARLEGDQLQALLAARSAEQDGVQLVILPAPRASTQALVQILDTATASGVSRIRLVQLGADP